MGDEVVYDVRQASAFQIFLAVEDNDERARIRSWRMIKMNETTGSGDEARGRNFVMGYFAMRRRSISFDQSRRRGVGHVKIIVERADSVGGEWIGIEAITETAPALNKGVFHVSVARESHGVSPKIFRRARRARESNRALDLPIIKIADEERRGRSAPFKRGNIVFDLHGREKPAFSKKEGFCEITLHCQSSSR